MIKSMTGYGVGKKDFCGKTFTVEIKSVNNRYSDFSVRIPRAYNFAEDALRRCASDRINRGKVDIFVNVEKTDTAPSSVRVDTALAKAYLEALKSLSEETGIESHASAETFLRIPDVFLPEAPEEDSDEITRCLTAALTQALDSFDEMRKKEGRRLYYDLSEHLAFVEEKTGVIEKRSPEIYKEYGLRLEERMREFMAGAQYDEARLMTEVALFADKINVNEETVRLRSHISQFKAMLESDVPVGRKTDFLIQEMNREINTIGSKSNDLEIAKIVIDVKAEIEKLREQIQNVE